MDVQLSFGRAGLTVALPDTAEVLRTRFTPGLLDDPQSRMPYESRFIPPWLIGR
jgi:hypothetical protein